MTHLRCNFFSLSNHTLGILRLDSGLLEEGLTPVTELSEPCLRAHVEGRIRSSSLDAGVVSVARISSLLLVKKRCWILVTYAEELKPFSSRTPGFAASRKDGRTESMKKKHAEQLNGRMIL
jgi:hypothetical protein